MAVIQKPLFSASKLLIFWPFTFPVTVHQLLGQASHHVRIMPEGICESLRVCAYLGVSALYTSYCPTTFS